MNGRQTAILVTVGPVLAVLTVLCLVPLGILFLYSFFHVSFVDIVPEFSLKNYIKIFSGGPYLHLILKALGFGALIAAITAVIAYPVAFFIAKRVVGVKAALLTALLVPLYTGDLVRIFAWRLVLGSQGVVNGLLMGLGIIHQPIEVLLFSPLASSIVLVYNYLPFMVLGLWLGFESLDNRLLEAAADLGAGRIAVIRRVILPLTAPGLATGALMVFALVVGDYLAPQLIGGASGVTVISAIADLFGAAFDWPLGSAIAWTLLAAIIVVMTALLTLLRRLSWGESLLGGLS